MTDKPRYEGAHAELTDRILGEFYKVANDLGFGFLETVYRRSLLLALRAAGLEAEEEVPVPVFYMGHCVGLFYTDIVVEGVVILELKAADQITRQHQAQLLHYLRASRMEVGLVLAFGERALIKRLVMTNDRKPTLPQSI